MRLVVHTYRNSDGVEAVVCNFLEIGEGDPAVPVLTKDVAGIGDVLSECVLVDDACRIGKLLKDGRRDPRLQNEPASEIDALDWVCSEIVVTFQQRETGSKN